MSLDPAVITALHAFITDAHLEGQALNAVDFGF